MSRSARLAQIAQLLLEQAVLDVLEEDYESGNSDGMQPSQIADRLDFMQLVRDRKGTRAARSDCIWGILVALDQKGLVDHLKDEGREYSRAKWRWHSGT